MYDWNELVLSEDDIKYIDKLKLIKQKKNIKLIVISGPSHSGKSTLAKGLNDKLSNSVVISQDKFFRKDVGQRLNGNYDLPQAIDHMRLRNKIVEEIESLPDNSILIVEGFMTYFDPFIPSLSDVNIWIDAHDPNILAKRREQTGQNFKGVQWYLDTVWSNHIKYVDYVDKLFLNNTNFVPRTVLDTNNSIDDNVNQSLSKIQIGGVKSKSKCPLSLSVVNFYDMVQVSESDLEKVMNSNQKTKKIYDKLINLKPKLEKIGKKVYFVPKPESLSGGYWGDYSYDYLEEKYNLDILKDNYVFFEFYLTKDGKEVDKKRGIAGITSEIEPKDKKTFFNILEDGLGKHVSWNGKKYHPIEISYSSK